MKLKQEAEKIAENVTRLKNKPLFMKAEGAEKILGDMAELLQKMAEKLDSTTKGNI
jgi:hypothetical protein